MIKTHNDQVFSLQEYFRIVPGKDILKAPGLTPGKSGLREFLK
jgi:hypothetical protein